VPTIPFPWLILIAFGLVVAVRVVRKVFQVLVLRRAARAMLKQVGVKALGAVPDAIKLERQTFTPEWRRPAEMEAMSRPLLGLGFLDCGVYLVDKMPGVRIWFLMNEKTRTAAFLYDHPKAPPWIEFSVRYENGSTCALSTLPATGIQPSPFFHRIQAARETPTGALYERLLKERPAEGIKPVTSRTVVAEYENAYLLMMLWQKNKGLSVEEVAAVGKKWLSERGR